MPGGRPSEYKPEYVQKVDEYLALKQDIEDGSKITVKLPTIEGFSAFLDVSKAAVYDWAAEHEEFSYALEKILRQQQERLLDKGLSGQYNSTIAKLILSHNHGMRERTDITSEDKALPTLPIIGMKIVHDEKERPTTNQGAGVSQPERKADPGV